MTLTVRPGILDIAPYVGGEAGLPGANRVVRLASNENPLGPSAQAIAAYRALSGELHRYPDGGWSDLRQAIAEVEGLAADQIVCGAGSDELIGLLVRAYAGPGDEVLHSAHGFLMYALAAKASGATPVAAPEAELTTDVDALLMHCSPRTRIVFVANPNNPTGSYISAAALRRLREGLPEDVLLVIDAAYAEYAEAGDYGDGAELVADRDNTVMLRTFSKIHGLAALRLGWAFCPPSIVAVLNRVRGPFNVGAAALAAGEAAIRDRDHAARSRDHNNRWRAWFAEQATAAGLTVYPSEGNFVLLRLPDGSDQAAGAVVALKAAGVLVRAMAGYGLPDCLRVTIGTEEEMRIAAAALAEFMA